jgi:NAD(P)-dependent dehydrogenase (short-subunit alcohol dehydrogenase family)
VRNVDVLINNAYYLHPPSSNDLTDSEFTYGLDGVLTSTFRCIKSIIPVFEKQSYGKIINVSSMYGIVSPEFDIYKDFPNYTNPPHYGAAKAGVLQLTRYFASLLAKNNIQVNSITPGPFPSEEVQKASKFIDELKDKTLLKKIGKPEDLAGAFTFLSSEASNYITGQNIIIDGGWTVK